MIMFAPDPHGNISGIIQAGLTCKPTAFKTVEGVVICGYLYEKHKQK